jgi:hypothetical protein
MNYGRGQMKGGVRPATFFRFRSYGKRSFILLWFCSMFNPANQCGNSTRNQNKVCPLSFLIEKTFSRHLEGILAIVSKDWNVSRGAKFVLISYFVASIFVQYSTTSPLRRNFIRPEKIAVSARKTSSPDLKIIHFPVNTPAMRPF